MTAPALDGVARRFSPRLIWPLVLVLHVVALLGVLRLEYDDALIRTFESDTPSYRTYSAFLDRFESDAGDVLVVFEGGDVADPAILRALTDFLFEVQFLEGVAGVVSPLGLRVMSDDGRMEPLVPTPVPSMAEMQARIEGLRADSPALSRLLSADRRLMMVAFPIGDTAEDNRLRAETLAEIDRLAQAAAEATGLRATLAGYPVVREEISKALFSDMILLNTIGVAVGLVVGAWALNSVVLGLLTAIIPATSLLWVMGMLGHMGISVNVITVALPVLILVLATSDAIHLSIEVGQLQRAGARHPVLRACLRIAPACIMAALTTAVAFAALTLSESRLITELGQAGAIATVLSMAAVLVTHPLVFLTADRITGTDRLFAGARARPAEALAMRALPAFAVARPALVSTAAVALLVGAVGAYLQVTPRYSLFDDMRADDPALQVLRRAEAVLGPSGAMYVPVALSHTGAIVAAEAAVRAQAGEATVFSLAAFAAQARASGGTLDTVAEDLPPPLAGRLISEDRTQAAISVLFPYVDSADTHARADALQAALAAEPAPEGVRFGTITGLTVMSADVSQGVLREFNMTFLVALVSAVGLMALWLRRPLVALVALVPNVLPIACAGAWLTLSGMGLEFASGLALTIAFGLAIDDTVHVLNRLRLSGGFDRLDDPAAVGAAVQGVAPALVITSLVLGLGMTGTLLASLTSLVVFGGLSMAVFVLALLADLLVLPACLIMLGRFRSRLARRCR